MRNFLALSLIVFCYSYTIAQNNVGIGTTAPNPNAILDLNNGNQGLGLLLPKVDVLAFIPAANDYGLFVYDTLQNQIFYWSGSTWNGVSPGWTLFGNSGTDSTINFLGTTDPQALIFKTNNINRMHIARTGNVGISASPTLNDRLYVFRSATSGTNDFGPNQSSIHGYRNGGNVAAEGGSSWAFGGVDAGVKGTSFWGNNFTAGLAGYNFNDFGNSAAVIGAQYNGTYWGALGFNDAAGIGWGVYTDFNSYVGGNEQILGKLGVGIGNAVNARAHILVPASDVTNNTVLQLDNQYGGASVQYGISNNMGTGTVDKTGMISIISNAASGARLVGVDSWMRPIGTGNQAMGFKSYIDNQGTGSRWAMYADVLSTATSTGPFFGTQYNIQNATAAGTSYGVYVGSSGVSSNKYGVFTTGENMNYFSTNVGIGVISPQYPLNIESANSFGPDFGTAVIYGNSQLQSNAMALEGNNTGNSAAVTVYSNAYLAGYAPNPTGTNNYGVWGHQSGTGVGGYGVLATNGANKTAPDRYVALAGITHAAIFMGGNVGINTTTPNSQLQFIQTDASIGGSSAIRYYWGANYWRTFHSGAHYSFEENGVRRAYVEAGTGNYVQPSDATLKKNISAMPSILSKVNQLNPVSYHYNDVSSDRNKTIGFLAQEVESLFPEIVRNSEDGKKALSYSDFSIIAIKAIQEQQKQIEALQEEIRLLKEKP